MKTVAYLFYGAVDGRVTHETPMDRVRGGAYTPIAPYTYVLHDGGLALHVAVPGFDAVVPLVSWPDGTVRDLDHARYDAATAVARGMAGRRWPRPLLPGVAYAIARDRAHPLWCHLGAYSAGMESPAQYSYIVAADGVYKWVHAPTYEAFVPLATYPVGTVAGLAALEAGARLLVPRAPAGLLATIVAEARVEAARTGNELLWQLCWRGDGWAIVKPDQRNGPGRVDYAHRHDGVIKVHSHGRFQAFWSPTDDADEDHAEFNVIVGDLRDAKPSVLCRAGVYGHTLPVPADILFEGPLPACDRYGRRLAPEGADGVEVGAAGAEIDDAAADDEGALRALIDGAMGLVERVAAASIDDTLDLVRGLPSARRAALLRHLRRREP